MDQTKAGSGFPVDEFEALVRTHQHALLQYAGRLINDPVRAQDVVQETFIRYLNTPPEAADAEAKAAWLFRVAHNLSVDLVKTESRRGELLKQVVPPDPVPPVSNVLAEREAWERLEGLLQHLSVDQRAVILLFYQQGKSCREIAEITGMSMSNVGMTLHRGLKKLRPILEDEGQV